MRASDSAKYKKIDIHNFRNSILNYGKELYNNSKALCNGKVRAEFCA